jgi:hypothetical protein
MVKLLSFRLLQDSGLAATVRSLDVGSLSSLGMLMQLYTNAQTVRNPDATA